MFWSPKHMACSENFKWFCMAGDIYKEAWLGGVHGDFRTAVCKRVGLCTCQLQRVPIKRSCEWWLHHLCSVLLAQPSHNADFRELSGIVWLDAGGGIQMSRGGCFSEVMEWTNSEGHSMRWWRVWWASPKGQFSSKCGPRPVASAFCDDLLELQILRPHSIPTESETLGKGPKICVLASPPGASEAY